MWDKTDQNSSRHGQTQRGDVPESNGDGAAAADARLGSTPPANMPLAGDSSAASASSARSATGDGNSSTRAASGNTSGEASAVAAGCGDAVDLRVGRELIGRDDRVRGFMLYLRQERQCSEHTAKNYFLD